MPIDFRRLHPRLTETDLDSTPFVPELSPVVNPHGDGLVTRPWLDWARRLTLLVGVKSTGGGGGGTGDVVGPAGATPDAIAIYSGSTGKLIKDSLKSIGSVISDAVNQAIAAILPGGKLPVSNLPLHKTTHQAGGVDAVDVKLLAGYPANNLVFLNGTGGFTTPVAGVPGPHHATHEPGGGDAMAVDAAAATGSLRTIGTGPLQATAGNDARLTNARTPTAHATTHQPGGSDAMVVDAVAATGSLRTLGTGANQAAPGNDTRFTIPANHAPRHSAGGADPVTVTNLAGYPGGTTNFLRADGAFATPAAGVPGPHHTTHEVGGADQLVNAAWTNQANVFTQPQKISAVQPALLLNSTVQPANQRQWVTSVASGDLYVQPADDTGTALLTALLLKRNGDGLVNANLTVNGTAGNVACKDQSNVFTQPQKISDSSQPKLLLNQSGGTTNQRQWMQSVYLGDCYFQPVDDSGLASATTIFMQRNGSIAIYRDIYEKQRLTPLGHTVAVPYNASDYVGLGGTWTVPSGNVLFNGYSLMGKTAVYTFILSDSSISGSATQLAIRNPVPGATGYAVGTMKLGPAEVASVYCNAGDANIYLIRAGVAAFPATTGTIWFTLTFQFP